MLSRGIKTLILSISTLFFLGGCGGTPTPAPKVEPLPKWINSPLPSDNSEFMYGMAIAGDRESAIKVALSDMVAKLGTTIESSYESNEEVRGGFVNSSIKNQIKSGVSKISINNYEVIKSHKVSYREFAVMLQSDKAKFVKGLKQNLEMQKKAISQKYHSLQGEDALTRYNTKKELSLKASELLSDVLIISEIDASFDKKGNLDFIQGKQKEFLNEAKSLKFYVNGDAKSSKFIKIIKNYLAQNGFNVTNSKDAIKIEAKTSDNINRHGSINIAVITLDIGVYDKNKRIGGKSIILKERYNGSQESVYKNASIHLEQDIKSQGINEVIGINLVENH
ncbi:MAG: LPP20 family lipoprotein [Sulfurimonas sp.]|uniref:LPP20 family lipoprotein n=1 Tax=Sulfurimonas sp. TaxID=2022749 RepID=UPI0025F0ACDE|nr:LPP20 family lipoprotein [Sulfurimonas sp.]MCK9491438.1 LPP20 family lipoprotein [Sulfurimonas sp.]